MTKIDGKKRSSRYSQIATIQNGQSNVRDIGGNRVIDLPDPSGESRRFLRFQDPRLASGEQLLDVTRWMEYPNLFDPFCRALLVWGSDKSPKGRSEVARDVGRGWMAFLDSLSVSKALSLGEISTSMYNQFIKWLNQHDDSGRSVWAVGTRRARLKALHVVLKHSGRLNAQEFRSPLVLKRQVWPGSSRLGKPTPVVSSATLRDLYRVCLKEASASMDLFRNGQELIRVGREALPSVPYAQANYKDLGVCLAALDQTYPGVIPGRFEIRKANKHLENAILAYHGFSVVPRYFYPQPLDLVPFVMLFAMYTAANPTQALDMRLSNFERQEVLGTVRLVWKDYKARSERTQIRSFAVTDDIDNPNSLLEFLERWTHRLRNTAPPDIHDALYLYVTKWAGKKAAATFSGDENTTWQTNRKKFLARHGLPDITLRMLRASSLDLVHELSGGDLRAVQAAGGQRSPEVINNHYTSDSARRRHDEKTGAAITLLDRWRDSAGLVDSRARGRDDDIGACTPGWRCLDPFASPVPGQKLGKACLAYGACPTCPLAHVDRNSPYALFRLLQLKQAIETAQARIGAERWLSVWGPRLEALHQHWLPQFTSQDVMKAAERLTLPPLAPIE